MDLISAEADNLLEIGTRSGSIQGKVTRKLEISGVHNESVYDLLESKQSNPVIKESFGANGAYQASVMGLSSKTINCQRDISVALATMKNSMKLLANSTKDRNFRKRCPVVISYILEWNDSRIQANSKRSQLSFLVLNTDECQEGVLAGTAEILKRYIVHCGISEEIDAGSQIHRESVLTTLLRPSLHEESKGALICTVNPSSGPSALSSADFFSEITSCIDQFFSTRPKQPQRPIDYDSGFENSHSRPETTQNPNDSDRPKRTDESIPVSQKRSEITSNRLSRQHQSQKELERVHFKKEESTFGPIRSEVDETITELEFQIEKLYDQALLLSPESPAAQQSQSVADLEYKVIRLANFVKKLGYGTSMSEKAHEVLDKLENTREMIQCLRRRLENAEKEEAEEIAAKRKGVKRGYESSFQGETNQPTRIIEKNYDSLPSLLEPVGDGGITKSKGRQNQNGQKVLMKRESRATYERSTRDEEDIETSEASSLSQEEAKPKRQSRNRKSKMIKSTKNDRKPDLPDFEETQGLVEMKRNLSDNISRIAFLEENIKLKDGVICSLETQLKKSQAETTMLQNELKASKERELVSVKNEEILKNALQEMEEQLFKGKTKKGKLDEKICRIQEDLSNELEVIIHAKRETEKRLEMAMRDLDQREAVLNDVQLALEKERHENERLNQMASQLDKKSKASIDELLYQVEFLEKKSNELKGERDSLLQRADGAEDQLRILMAKRNKQKAKNNEEAARIQEEKEKMSEKRRKKCGELKKRANELEKKLKKSTNDAHAIKIENERLVLAKENLSVEMEKTKGELSQTKHQMAFATRDLETFKEENGEMKRVNKELQDRLQRTLDDNRELERGLQAYEAKFLEAQNEIQADIEMMNALKSENSQLHSKIAGLESTVSSLQGELRFLDEKQAQVDQQAQG